MIKYNPQFKSDGTQNGALTTAPSDSIIFDVPGKCIWVKGVKLATSHTYTFSHDNYITLTNTPGEPEDILIGVNTTALKNAIDTTYGIVNASTNGLAPMFSNANKTTASAATTYNFLGIAGSTLKWYQLPWRNIRINSDSTDKLGVNDTDPLIISQGTGISVTWDSTNKKIVITNTSPDLNHNTDRTGIIKSTVSGTKKTDTTLIVANSSSGLIFEGGTNLFKIGDGTNYVEIPVTPSFTVTDKSANILTSLTTLATIAGTDIKAKITVEDKAATIGTSATTIATIGGTNITAKIGSYAASSHTHSVKINGSEKTIAAPGGTAVDLGSYLPLAGGTMNAGAMIIWQDWGQWGASSPTYPKANGGLQWSGTSDNLKLFAEETASDDLRLILQCGDDASPQFNIRNYLGTTTVSLHSNGTITGTSIVNSGSNNNYVLLGGGGTKLISDFATSGHTHPLSIAADSGTSSIALVASTKYKLTAGGSTYVFTSTPDEKVRQVPKTDNTNRPLMMINGGTSQGEQVNTSMFCTGIYANASTNTIFANAAVLNTNLTIKGTSDVSSLVYGGGGFHNKYANIVLKGDASSAVSGIVFTSSKGDTSINVPSDCAFIQFHPYGHSALAAIGSNPTLNTSGESNKLVIGVNNDSDDMVYLQTPALTGLKHVVGTSVYTIWDSGNDGSGSGLDADLLDGTHKADLLTAASLGASGNSTTLSVTVGGTTKTGSVTVPYSLNSDKLDGIDSSDFMRRYLADGTVALNGNNFGYNAILGTVNGNTYTGNNGKGLDNRSVILHFTGGKYTGHWNLIYINSGSMAFRTEDHLDWWEILHSGNYTSYCATASHNHDSRYLRKDTNDSTPYQYSFTKTNDHAIQVGTIRGRAVGSQTGEYIHMYNRVHIGGPSGWGASDAPAPDKGLSTYGAAWLAMSTGNVGIGTTSPSHKLHTIGKVLIEDNVSGGGTTNSLLNILFNGTHEYGVVMKIHSYGGDSPGIRFSHSSSASELNSQVNTNWTIGMYYNTYDRFAITQDRGTNGWGTHRLVINSSGNVGIGTDSPSYKLHVIGTGYFTGTIYGAGQPAFQTAAGTGNWNYIRMHNGSNFWDFATLSSSNSGALEFRPAGASNIGPYITPNGMFHFNNISNSSYNYDTAAVWIREYHYSGAGSDTWGQAPRLAWHWGGRVAALIGLASNGWLYEAPLTATNFYRIVVENGGSWNIIANPAAHTHDHIEGPDWRSTSHTPLDYMSTYHKGSLTCEFSSTSVLPIAAASNGYSALVTITPWGDSSGGLPAQIACGNNGWYFRCASSTTAWGGFNVYWNSSGDVYARHYYETSDIRLKHDISMLSKSIRRFRFNNDNKLYYGFIAQELETLHPELVDSSGEYKTVNYNSAICYYIAELENKVQKLEDEINKLKNK